MSYNVLCTTRCVTLSANDIDTPKNHSKLESSTKKSKIPGGSENIPYLVLDLSRLSSLNTLQQSYRFFIVFLHNSYINAISYVLYWHYVRLLYNTYIYTYTIRILYYTILRYTILYVSYTYTILYYTHIPYTYTIQQ